MGKVLTYDEAVTYARSVVDGGIPMGKWVTLACRRFLADLDRAEDPSWPYYFDSVRVDRILALAGEFKHSKGEYAGLPFQPSPWQVFIIANIFGFYYRPGVVLSGRTVEQGERIRRFSESYVMVARGNGKTFFAAWMALVAMVADGEAGAEFYNLANSEDQALICFKAAVGLAKSCDHLRQGLHDQVSDFTWGDSTWRNLHSNAGSLDGSMPYWVIVDESHEMTKSDLYDVMETGMGKRGMRAHMMLITTAGLTDDESHFGMTQYNLALNMLEPEKHGIAGHVADGFFSYVAQLDDGDDVYDPSLLIKANPNIGISVSPEKILAVGEKARGDRAKYASYLAKHCCKWGQRIVTWLDMDAWDKCTEYKSGLGGERCIVGIDIGLTGDLSAVYCAFFGLPGLEPGAIAINGQFFIPGDEIAKKSKVDNVPYLDWAEAGHVRLTAGNTTDFAAIRSYVAGLRAQYGVEAVAYDKAHCAQLAQELEAFGCNMVSIPQGLALNEAIRRLEELVMSQRIHETRKSPALRAHAKNASIKVTHDGRAQLYKGGQLRHHIDGIAAIANAIHHLLTVPVQRVSIVPTGRPDHIVPDPGLAIFQGDNALAPGPVPEFTGNDPLLASYTARRKR